MVARKPIVLNAGQLEQLQSGDSLDANLAQLINRINANAATINIGEPVYSTSATSVDLSQANAQSTIRIAGLVADITIAAAAAGNVAVDGVLVATTGQWDAVTGQTGGLTPGADYFLDPSTPGRLTTTAPTTAGQFVVRVGHALSDTEFEIEIQQPIKL
jgi:hypothetical protein